jgi:hypothetical protein
VLHLLDRLRSGGGNALAQARRSPEVRRESFSTPTPDYVNDYVNDGDMIAMLRLGVLDTLGELRS